MVTCHAVSHSVTCHAPDIGECAITPVIQAAIRFTYPGGMEGWVDASVGYTEVVYLSADSHPSRYYNHLIVTRPGVEPTTSGSQVQRPNRYTTKPPTTTTTILIKQEEANMSIHSSANTSQQPCTKLILLRSCSLLTLTTQAENTSDTSENYRTK